MTADQQPRYEYRIWADKFGFLKDELQRLAREVVPDQVSEEVYVLSGATDDCNAKIRGGRLNIKSRIATEHRLELWEPVLDAEFPLDRSVIAGQIFPCLEVGAPNLRRARYSIENFREIIQPQHQLAIVPARKRRTRFRLADCLGEFTSVVVGKINLETIALESIKAHSVLRLMDQLQIADRPNTSYVRQLKEILTGNPGTASRLSRKMPKSD